MVPSRQQRTMSQGACHRARLGKRMEKGSRNSSTWRYLEIPGVQPVGTIKLRDFRNLKQLENHQRLRLLWFLVISANSSFPRVHEFRAYINLDIACLFSRAREIPGWNNQNMYTCLWTFDEVQNNSKNNAKRKTSEFIIWVRTKTPVPCSSHYNS